MCARCRFQPTQEFTDRQSASVFDMCDQNIACALRSRPPRLATRVVKSPDLITSTARPEMVLAEHFGIDTDLSDAEQFRATMRQLGAESLDTVELLMELDEEFFDDDWEK